MADQVMGLDDWRARLRACTSILDDLMVGYWVEHWPECASLNEQECDCGLVALFSTGRAVIAVDDSLTVAQFWRH